MDAGGPRHEKLRFSHRPPASTGTTADDGMRPLLPSRRAEVPHRGSICPAPCPSPLQRAQRLHRLSLRRILEF